jgi:hypothetical protein
MRVVLWTTDEKTPIEEMEGKESQVVGEAETLNLWPDTSGRSLIGPPSKLSACVR